MVATSGHTLKTFMHSSDSDLMIATSLQPIWLEFHCERFKYSQIVFKLLNHA